MLEMTIICFV